MTIIMDKYQIFEIQFKVKIKSTEQELSLQQRWGEIGYKGNMPESNFRM